MLRDTYSDHTMYFSLIFLCLLYSVNSLTEVSINNSSTVIPPITNKTSSSPVKSHLLNEKVDGTTEAAKTETRKEAELSLKEGLLKLINKPPVIGRLCKNNTDCNAQNNSVCLNGICQCQTDYVASPNNRTCLLKAKALQDDCMENVQCDSIYGVSGLVVCASFHCVCSANAVLINNRCYRKTLLGKTCGSDDECASIQFSYCFQGVCACDPDFFPDDTGTQCFPFSNGTNNMTNIDCKGSSLICKVLGEHAYCSNDTCVCFPGYHLNKNLCVNEKSLGEYCESNSDCEVDMQPKEKPGARECKNNKCTCIKGYKAIPEHNICKNGSSMLSQSLLLILSCLFYLFK